MKPFAFLAVSLLLGLRAVMGTADADDRRAVPFYAIEEHWASPALIDLFANNPLTPLFGAQPLLPVLGEVGPSRLASMDANNILVQVVSHAPMAAEAMFMAPENRLANDQLAQRIAAYPNRFKGFCILPMALPAVAAEELKRCIKRLDFVGALVDAHIVTPNGTSGRIAFFDGPEYDVLWAMAVRLDVPIYLHPTFPPLDDMLVPGKGLYAPAVPGQFTDYQAAALGTAAWGWHSNAGLGFLKMYLGGVFDRFPQLQVVLGHMGEMVPYYLSRADRFLSLGRPVRLRDVYKNNVYVTTSGIFTLDAMHTLLNVTDTHRVIYSIDWPFAKNEDGKAFMALLEASGLVTREQFKDIAYRNVKRLLKI
jgi:predicted TIM-barrel fold metal-dependent hydrolase